MGGGGGWNPPAVRVRPENKSFQRYGVAGYAPPLPSPSKTTAVTAVACTAIRINCFLSSLSSARPRAAPPGAQPAQQEAPREGGRRRHENRQQEEGEEDGDAPGGWGDRFQVKYCF